MGNNSEKQSDCIKGNLRFEFFTSAGSLTIEAWHCTRKCTVTTYSSGIRKRTEIVLNDNQWCRLVTPISNSGVQFWEKRYDSHIQSGYAPSWSFSLQTENRWYISSGDGEFPDGFFSMLRCFTQFASEVEGSEHKPVKMFLSTYVEKTEA